MKVQKILKFPQNPKKIKNRISNSSFHFRDIAIWIFCDGAGRQPTLVIVTATHLAITEQQPTPLLRMIVGYSSAVYLTQSQLTLSITIVLLGAAVNTYT